MSSGFQLVDVEGWEWDLQSVCLTVILFLYGCLTLVRQVYSAYMGYFQARNIPWFDFFNATHILRVD